MLFQIVPEHFFFSQRRGIFLRQVVSVGEESGSILLSDDALPLLPLLEEDLAGKLFLITEEESHWGLFGSSRSHEHGVKHVMAPILPPPEIRTVVIGRFAPVWEGLPKVAKAFALTLDVRQPEPSHQWSDNSLVGLMNELASHLESTAHSRVLLRVGTEEVLKQFPEHGYRGYVRQDVLVHALLALPVTREELSLKPYILEWCREDLASIHEGQGKCEEDRLQATRDFEAAIDKMMRELRPLRDRARLHQAWLQANPEPEPVTESVVEPSTTP